MSNDIEARIERLRAESAAKRQAEQAAQQSDRVKAWGRIQREAPDVAGWLVDMKRVFGSPARVWVTIGNERVL